MEIAYVGTQSLTPDNTGCLVYGGSELRVARGGFDALRRLDLADRERRAIDWRASMTRRYRPPIPR